MRVKKFYNMIKYITELYNHTRFLEKSANYFLRFQKKKSHDIISKKHHINKKI